MLLRIQDVIINPNHIVYMREVKVNNINFLPEITRGDKIIVEAKGEMFFINVNIYFSTNGEYPSTLTIENITINEIAKIIGNKYDGVKYDQTSKKT